MNNFSCSNTLKALFLIKNIIFNEVNVVNGLLFVCVIEMLNLCFEGGGENKNLEEEREIW